MLRHIGQKCRFCDPAVRNAVVELQAQQAAREGIPSGRPRYGSRKVFFEVSAGNYHWMEERDSLHANYHCLPLEGFALLFISLAFSFTSFPRFQRIWERLHGGGGVPGGKEGTTAKDVAKKADYDNHQDQVAAAVAEEAEKISAMDPSTVAATGSAIDDKRKANEISTNEDVGNKKQKTDEEAAAADAEKSVEV